MPPKIYLAVADITVPLKGHVLFFWSDCREVWNVGKVINVLEARLRVRMDNTWFLPNLHHRNPSGRRTPSVY